MIERKLKLAFLCNERIVSHWLYSIIAIACESNIVEMALLIFPKKTLRKDILHFNEGLTQSGLYQNFIKRDRQKYTLAPDAFASKNLFEKENRYILELDFLGSEGNLEISLENAKELRAYNLDVLINLTGYELSELILDIPIQGVWTYAFGDYNKHDKSPAGVFEFLKNSPTTAIRLVGQYENGKETIILSESFSSTDKFGIYRNLNNCLWKAPYLLVRELKKLYLNGPKVYYQGLEGAFRATASSSSNTSQKSFYPTTTEIVGGLAANYWRRLRKKIDRKSYFEQYILLFKLDHNGMMNSSFSQFTRITPPKDRFWADPFVYYKNETYYIFIEELIYSNGLGTIGVIEMDRDGNYKGPRMVLEKNYHLSYPFLIEDDNQLFMIPESNADRSIQLYRCTDFPLKWELQEIIMSNVSAVDTTIFYHNGKFWMFTNMKEHPGISAYDELFLFYSDTLIEGNWKPHPQNPIVSDVRTARPAGNIFREDNKIYRPAQNCAKRYGHGMQLAEITTLNEFKYEERIRRSIYPDWADDLRTTHTITSDGNLIVIDALIGRPK